MTNNNYNYENYWQGEFERREKEGYYQKLYGNVKDFYKFAKSDKIVDVGGGNGQLANFLGAKNVTVVDISNSGLKFAKEKFGFQIIKQDLSEKLKLTDNHFDVALCCEVLEHLKDPSFVLGEINRVLKKERILYIGQDNMRPDGKHHLQRIHFRYLVNLLKENNFKVVNYIIVSGFLTNKFSNLKKSYNDSLRKTAVIITGSILNLLLPKSFKRFLTNNFPRYFGGFYYVKAKKM